MNKSKFDPNISNAQDIIDYALGILPEGSGESYYLLDWLVTREPQNGKGILWLAHVTWGYILDTSALLRVKYLIENFKSKENLIAAAHLSLLYKINDELRDRITMNISDQDMENILITEMKLAPEWPRNRIDFALHLIKKGDQSVDMLKQVKIAQSFMSLDRKFVKLSEKELFEQRKSNEEYEWNYYITGKNPIAFKRQLETLIYFAEEKKVATKSEILGALDENYESLFR